MAKDLFGICPFVTSQKILQGKWAILVLHELSQGTRRFNELERGLQITHATLSSQLKSLEREGIVRRTVYPERAAARRVQPDGHRPEVRAGTREHPGMGDGLHRLPACQPTESRLMVGRSDRPTAD